RPARPGRIRAPQREGAVGQVRGGARPGEGSRRRAPLRRGARRAHRAQARRRQVLRRRARHGRGRRGPAEPAAPPRHDQRYVPPDRRLQKVGSMTYVVDFADGEPKRKDLLGGKGAGLVEMTRLGLPVPPGFIVTTEACTAYYRDGK